jgi:hypothetical protein
MKRKALRAIALRSLVLVVVVAAAWQTQAQDAKAPYPSMAPLDQYLMERDAEIALARSAAPQSISQDGEVMVLGRHGNETVVKGKNGFVGSGANSTLCRRLSDFSPSIESYSGYANAACQIAGVVAVRRPSLPILYCPFLIFSASSIGRFQSLSRNGQVLRRYETDPEGTVLALAPA